MLGNVTKCESDHTVLSGPEVLERPVYELAVRIDFEGLLAATGEKVGGYLIGGSVRGADIQPLLSSVAAHLGLDPAILETEAGPQNLLNELLNIVIGLTGADWAGQGFDINFSPPAILSGHTLPPSAPGDQVFQLIVSASNGIQVDIVLVFNASC
jgi:hypothetical protein